MPDPIAELQLNKFEQRRRELIRERTELRDIVGIESKGRGGYGPKAQAASKRINDIDSSLQKLDKDEYESSFGAQAKHLALGVGGVPVGMYVGARYAGSIQKKQDLAIQARNAELNKLGKKVEKILPKELPAPTINKAGKVVKVAPQRKLTQLSKQKLGAIVVASDKLGLSKRAPFGMRGLSGPLALPTAGLLLGEAAFSRFVVGNDQSLSETTREVAKGVGTGLATTAVTIVGKRALHNATTQQLTNAASAALVEKARKVAGKEAVAAAAKAGAKTVSGAKALLGFAGKAGPIAAGALALGVGIENYSRTGSVKRAAAAALDTTAFGLTDFEGKVAVLEAKKRLGDMKTALSGGARMQQLRVSYAKGAKKTDVTKPAVRRKAKLQRQSSLGEVFVKGHYATSSTTGQRYYVQGHLRSLA